jgi:hypothetical protein
MDLTFLGLSVRSDEVRKANDELGRMPGAAKRAEDAAQGFAKRTTGAAKRVVAANDNVAKSATLLGNAYIRLAAIIGGLLSGAIASFSLKSFIDATIEADKVQA